MTKSISCVVVSVALVLGMVVGSIEIPVWADNHRMVWVTGEYPETYALSMEESAAAFMRRDMDATYTHMAEDFATYELHGEDAPRLLVEGRDATVATMKRFFAGNFGSSWDGADVERLGSIGNTMVQIEHDRYKTNDGMLTISTFVIIQYKNGKRWREWRLRPDPAS
ncbi:MAG: hypothetical protein ACJZ9F_09480 [Rhodospirillaceae bacterium]